MVRTRQSDSGRRRGFTLVELIAVIGIIVVLVSILLVAMGGARRSAQRAQTSRQLSSITTAMDAFKTDFGWYPPLLINNDEGGNPTALLSNGASMYVVPEAAHLSGLGTSTDDYRSAMSGARYHSTVSITVYLVGAGNLNGDLDPNSGGEWEVYDLPGTDRLEPNFDDGADGPGIRNPGALDKSWGGGADRSLQDPMNSANGAYPDDGATRYKAQVAVPRGRVYGPYLDPGILGDRLVRGGDAMFEIEDSFGYPIRYYRGFPTRNLADNQRDLSVVPIELRSFESFDAQMDGDISGANSLDQELMTAEFVLLSCGSAAKELFTAREAGVYERWVGPKDDGLVPPYGDIIRSHSNRLLRLQKEWGDLADKGTLDTDLETIGLDNLGWALESNVRSMR